MLSTTNIHDVTAIRAGGLVVKQHTDGTPYYWRTFVFITNEGGEIAITAFADTPAALPEITQPQEQAA